MTARDRTEVLSINPCAAALLVDCRTYQQMTLELEAVE
ncbi:hypothetical protein phi2LM21_p25 [Sinorhizobium phage phi2LM21]|nr:hypothetical protein phi2LM21_p25 [Sinorhizobium phage phi2LM21]